MTKVIIRTDDAAGFFSRAKDAARQADHGQPFEDKVTLSFEDPQRIFTVLSEARRRLMLQVMTEAKSINELTHRLHRNGSAITKDVGLLEKWAWSCHVAKPIPDMGFRRLCSLLPPELRWWRRWGDSAPCNDQQAAFGRLCRFGGFVGIWSSF